MPFTWTQLQDEVYAWGQKNFPASLPMHPVWGLLEELGELAHAHLKAEQGIRGSISQHEAAAQDAIADSVIYFMDVCGRHGLSSQALLQSNSPEEFQTSFSTPMRQHPLSFTLMHLSLLVGQLESIQGNLAEIGEHTYAALYFAAPRYLYGLSTYCSQRGWSLQAILEEVWPKVRARDWTKNKTDGGSATPAALYTAPGIVEAVGVAAYNPDIKKIELSSDTPSE